MTLLIFGEGGLELHTQVTTAAPFVPRTGAVGEVDQEVQGLWQLLPSDLHDLPTSDRAVLETVWSAYLRYFSEGLVEATHLDQFKSLLNAPLLAPRRWVRLATQREERWSSPPDHLVDDTGRAGGVFDTSSLDAAFALLRSGRVFCGVTSPLRSALRGDTTLAFSASWSMSTPDGDYPRWVLWGYGAGLDCPTAQARTGLFVAVSTQGRCALLILDAGVSPTEAMTSDRVQVIDLGSTASIPPNGVSTLEVVIEGQFEGFDTRGARVEVQWSVGGLSRTVVEYVRYTRSTEAIEDGIHVPWGADRFGVSAPWGRLSEWTTLFEETVPGFVRVDFGTVSFTDPTTHGSVVTAPLLQPHVLDTSLTWAEGVDYLIARDPARAWAYFKFLDAPPEALWAEAMGLDLGLLKQVFGPLTGVEPLIADVDRERTRCQIVGALYGYLAGPHVGALSLALGALLGAPIALAPGVVIGLVGPHGGPAIVVREAQRDRVYDRPENLPLRVAVGDVVEVLDPFVELPEVHDWVSAPLRMAALVQQEVERFGALGVEIPVGYIQELLAQLPQPLTDATLLAFGGTLSSQLRSYLLRALAVWVGATEALLSIGVRLTEEDDAIVEDNFRLSSRHDAPDDLEYSFIDHPTDRTTLHLWEGLSGVDVNAHLYSVTSELYSDEDPDAPTACDDFLYDQVETGVLADPIRIIVSYDGVDSGPLSVQIYGEEVTLEHGETHTFVQPEGWGTCAEDLEIDLDFSNPFKSGWIPVI